MTASDVRPDVGELHFHVFARPLHPELFHTLTETIIQQAGYTATIRLCEAGHVIIIRSGTETLTEVVAPRDLEVSATGQLASHPLRGHRSATLSCGRAGTYHIGFQLEQLTPEVFAHFQEELLLDSLRSQVAWRFPAAHRMAAAPLSFAQIEEKPGSLLVHAFHTFPQNHAVVKTQSLFEM